MSAIDPYNHTLLGFIECPSEKDFVFENRTRKIALYRLNENIPTDERSFDGKTGDILIGGGSGEAPAMRLSVPEIFDLFKNSQADHKNHEIFFKTFWTPTQYQIFCEGYSKLGWPEKQPIEIWLAENIVSILVQHIDIYKKYKTTDTKTSGIKFETGEMPM